MNLLATSTVSDLIASLSTSATAIAGQVFDIAVPALAVFVAILAVRLAVKLFRTVAK